MSKRLSLQYYYMEDGSLDPFTEYLTCFDEPLYFLLKNKFGNLNPCEAFLRDTTFYLSQNSDGSIYDIGFLDNSINSDLFKLKWYGGKGNEALAQVETLLDSGELVMIQTDTRRVPFFKYYQGSNTDDNGVAVPGHVFLAVYHDKSRLYFVEAPWNHHPNNFVPYEGNPSIGVINKEDLRFAFESFLNCITITLSEEGLFKVDRIRTVIEKSIKNYEKRALNSDGFIFTYGKEAIEKLIEICQREFLYLNQEVMSYSLNLYGLLFWKFWDIIKRRDLLYEYFLKYSKQFNNPDVDALIKIMADLKNAWRVISGDNGIITGMYTAKKYLLDASLVKYFKDILDLEGQLNAGLKKLHL